MERVQGNEGVALVECINPYINKYRIRWDVQPYVNDDSEEYGVSYYETDFVGRKPSMDDVKQEIALCVNKQTDRKILEGFVWNGMQVWLSTENQFNFKAAYDLAVQSGGASLPVTFKFGTDTEPVYHEFTEIGELSDFYTKALGHISACLAEGWRLKDGINMEDYERFL